MAAQLFVKPRIPNLNTKAKLKKKKSLPSDLSQYAFVQLSKREQDALLHKIITSNLPYYLAVARYHDRREQAATGRVTEGGRMWHKNLRLCFRLTESGLKLLKTGFAKKPKNPV